MTPLGDKRDVTPNGVTSARSEGYPDGQALEALERIEKLVVAQSNENLSRVCDVKGCGLRATEWVREREKPRIRIPVCTTHALALITVGHFYERAPDA